MPEDLDQTISQALTDHGGPPELAPQLVAIGRQRQAETLILPWIRFFRQGEWSGIQFQKWLHKYFEAAAELAALDKRQ